MDFEQYRKQFPATRSFQRYTSEQRANHAASHRLTVNQRNAVGEYYYTHVHAPGLAFPRKTQAEKGGYERYQAQLAENATTNASAAPMPPIHLTYTGPLAGTTLCGAPRGEGKAHHAVYAPVQLPAYREQCCKACLATFAKAWDGVREKPDWVVEILSAEPAAVQAEQFSLFPSTGDSHAN
jgi:hypothetical protein